LSPTTISILAGLSFAARDQLQADGLLVDLRGGQRQRAWGAVQREQGVQPEAPEEAAVAGAVAVVGCIAQRGAAGRFDAARALHRGGVDQHQLVVEAGAVARELGDQRLDDRRQSQPALVKGAALGQRREQVHQSPTGDRQELLVGAAIEHRLSDAQRDDLLIGDPSPSVGGPARQEIVDGAVNSDQQQIEVGVHRGPPQGRRLAMSTADFDLPAYVPFSTPTTRRRAVAQLI